MFPSWTDRIFEWALRLATLLTSMIVVFILVFLVKEALPLLLKMNPLRFFSDPSWHPTQGVFNMLPMIMGSLLVTLGALLIAAPLAVLSAICCQYYAPSHLAVVYESMLSLMAGIPSVVYGLWGLLVLVPWLREFHAPGHSLLAGMLILALMVLPTISLSANVSLRALPQAYSESATALGLSQWQIIGGVLLPAAKPGLVSGMLLGTGRALGETMAVLMVTGNIVQVPGSLFEPMRTLTANIALEMAYALDDHRSALYVSALILFALVSLLIKSSEFLQLKASEKPVCPT